MGVTTPDITPAQILAVLKFVVAFLVARTLISDDQAQLVLEIAGTVVPCVLFAADAYIRRGRAKVAEAQVFARASEVSLAQATSQLPRAAVDPDAAGATHT